MLELRYPSCTPNRATKINLFEKQIEENNEIIESILKKFDLFDILEVDIAANDTLIKELDNKINQSWRKEMQ